MSMEDWSKRLDAFLEFDERDVLRDSGKISARIAQIHAENEFEKYRVVQDRLFESDFDRAVEKLVAGKPSTREDRQAPASGSVEVSVQAIAANGAAQLHSGRR